MIRRLRLHFILIIMAVVTALLLVILGIVLTLTAQSLERESVARMRELALEPQDAPKPGDQVDGLRLAYFVLRVSDKGAIVKAYGRDFDLTDEEKVRSILTSAETDGKESGRLPQYHLRYEHLQVPSEENAAASSAESGGASGKEQDSAEETYVFADMSGETSMMRHLMKNCLVMAGGGFLLFLLFSVILANWFVKPVEKTLKDQKAFIADASHELKTPLTVMLTNTEMLKDPSYSEADRRVFVDHLSTVTKQMRSLVEELLDLARIDQNLPRTPEDVDFSDLIENELLLFEAPFFEAGLEVESHVEKDLTVRGDATQLRQAVDVLLDNARKYAAPHSVVSVQLTASGNSASLSVASEGALLAREEQEKIFQRFYRTDASRQRNGSYGLGLPIAAAIVQQHHGTIGVSTGDGRNDFTIRLPMVRRRKL
ncbi:sensor histidine kinase [Chordicoccus furentiruminis]|uniref:sensor histidine kinase n=1 Tax=Chordicoccus furentiruminis TaxID=2709410 RepID=UPI0023A8CE1C|nr:HAMP domain-containing sensor histidine kinase [Chordicoccus furentiruminis]